jgi:hypothetical protein
LGYFSDQTIDELYYGWRSLDAMANRLLELFVARDWANDRAKEYATHGLSRRIYNLKRCIDRVFELLPPERDAVPNREDALDATINIQAFTLNAFGCLENLAWIWSFQRPVMKADGGALSRSQVGLWKSCKSVRASFSPEFSGFLESREPWFEHLKDFRDALAHRIPLYIPPLTIPTGSDKLYAALEQRAFDALRDRDRSAYEKAKAEQKALESFRPWMIHSPNEGSVPVVFHPQLIADFRTIDEIARELLAEMGRAGC